MKKITIALLATSVLLGCLSCNKDFHEVYAPDELGVPESEFYVDAEGGDVEIEFLANKVGDIYLVEPEDASWAQIIGGTFEADGTVKVHIQPNAGFRRSADIRLETPTRKVTVTVFQEGGVEDKFYVAASSMVAYNGQGGLNTVLTDIAVPLDEIQTEIRHSGDDDWVTDLTVGSSTLTFRTADNPDKSYMRRALIVLTYIDGWKREQTAKITVIQPRTDNQIGTEFSAEQLRKVATAGGYILPEDAIIEGYIVSTNEFGNAGDAVVDDYFQGTGAIDYTLTERTSYLVSKEGYGFRMIATDAGMNDFERFSYIRLKVGGAIIRKSLGEPVYYTIDGIESYNMLTSEDATLTMPRKVKSIDELTDDDINTLVTLKDCEFAMRKGPFTPVNEGYGTACGYNRLAKYPTLIRDKKGGSMYMFTNMTCTYRRNGETLPYGSGNITGIVVHEDYKSFEKDGNIGRYQLRHLTREEIDLKKDFKDNFSEIITEFRYAKFPGEFEETILENPILATKGNGELCHTYSGVNNYSPSYFYIGECGNNRKNKVAAGAGIELEDGSIYAPWENSKSSQNDDGKGWYSADCMLSWSNKNWWDSDNSRGYCWLVNFSTEGIHSDHVSMQFAMYNNSQSARSPRYWKAQYSLTTTDCSPEADDKWIDIAEFTVHDVAMWEKSGVKYQNDWQTLGTRVYDFPLPLEVLNKESVSIRLMPRNNKAAKKDISSYDSSTIANGTGYNTMDYFAVRYNK